MSPFQTQTFKCLESEWYKKLENEGFEDAENTKSEARLLKKWHSVYFKIRHHPLSINSSKEYYRLASHFSYEHVFQTELEKNVWDLHAEGFTLREIAKRVGSNKDILCKMVNRLTNMMFEEMINQA